MRPCSSHRGRRWRSSDFPPDARCGCPTRGARSGRTSRARSRLKYSFPQAPGRRTSCHSPPRLLQARVHPPCGCTSEKMSFLDREATIAGPGFNRWVVPPAAIAVHMCIGQVYGFSVFKKPLAKALGVTSPAPGDWSEADVGVAYSIALALLGLSAAFCGKWVERNGPRKTMLASMLCFCSGLVLSAIAVRWHNLWLLYAGYGLIGGVGLGLGYISPVSTLMKWFPDRPGMATGMAIMGFGGGALIGGPLAEELMQRFASASSVGASEAMLVMAGMYADLDDFRGVDCACAARGMVPTGMVGARAEARLVTHSNVGSGPRLEDAAILDVVGGAVHERKRRHWHSRPGLTDDSGHVPGHSGRRGRLCRVAFALQPGRPVPLVVALRCHRAQGDFTASISSSARSCI